MSDAALRAITVAGGLCLAALVATNLTAHDETAGAPATERECVLYEGALRKCGKLDCRNILQQAFRRGCRMTSAEAPERGERWRW